jgi:hypothetical protein
VIGPIVVIVAIVIAIPVAVLMSGAAASGILGYFLKTDAEDRFKGSELLDLN